MTDRAHYDDNGASSQIEPPGYSKAKIALWCSYIAALIVAAGLVVVILA